MCGGDEMRIPQRGGLCRSGARPEGDVDMGPCPEGRASRSLTRAITAQGGNTAGERPRTAQQEDDVCEWLPRCARAEMQQPHTDPPFFVRAEEDGGAKTKGREGFFFCP